MARWTDNLVNMVGARSAHFPPHNVDHWNRLRTAAASVRELLRDLDKQMAAIEDSPDLNASGKTRQRSELAKQAHKQLASFTKLQLAEHAAEQRVEKLEANLRALLSRGAPKDAAEIAMAAEIRAFVRAQGDKAILFATERSKAEPRILSAILSAPAFLSGMTDDDLSNLRSAALDSTDPAQEKKQLIEAVDVCRGAVARAHGLISERAGTRHDPDGEWRAASEPIQHRKVEDD